MKNKVMFMIIAAAVAGSASSALAGDTYQHHAHKSKIERYSDPQLSEGRNSSHWSGYLTNVSSDRESMVETLGN
jgi:hypothetical protein